MPQAVVVLVHGAAAGSWTWHQIVDGLAKRGVKAIAVDLPSCSAPDASVDAHDDALFLRGILDEIDASIVLVGNSYGGIVISEAAVAHPKVMRLVYLAALMPRPEERITEIMAGLESGLTDAVHILEDGRIVIDPEIDIRSSFQQSAADEHAFIRSRLGRPMSIGLDPSLALSKVAWESIPSTYVVCTEDLTLSPDAQRTWAKERATDFLEWPSDHSPQHSHPEPLVHLLERLAK